MIVASIDIGTNTVILLIADVDLSTSKITPMVNETRMPRIGKGVIRSGFISSEKLEMLYSILEDYDILIKNNNCERIIVSGTNAFRLAHNTPDIVKEIKKKFDYNLNVISGEDEANFAFLGAISNMKNLSDTLVIDIGGSSTEIIYGNKNKITSKKSLQIGSVVATEKYLIHSPPLDSEVKKLQKVLLNQIKSINLSEKPKQVIAVAGTATTIACMILELKKFQEEMVNNFNINLTVLNQLIYTIRKFSSFDILKNYGDVLNGREDIILAGSYILQLLMSLLDIEKVIVSTRGIRYGAILNSLQ